MIVAQLNELAPGQRKLVKAGGYQIALFNVEGILYAINNSCPHSTGPLIKGRLSGVVVTCPWHGAQFDITTGKCCNGPATSNVTAYPVHLKEDGVFIEIS
jgi:nitrite reductase/ring-hydroxylating ferredoxin subunit